MYFKLAGLHRSKEKPCQHCIKQLWLQGFSPAFYPFQLSPPDAKKLVPGGLLGHMRTPTYTAIQWFPIWPHDVKIYVVSLTVFTTRVLVPSRFCLEQLQDKRITSLCAGLKSLELNTLRTLLYLIFAVSTLSRQPTYPPSLLH